jgi:hypothetical protein
MMRSFLLANVALVVVMCVSSCSVNNSSTNPSQASFLVANVSPDATPVNVFINSSQFQAQMDYGSYTPYYSLTAGNYTITVTNVNNSTIINNTITLDVNKLYSYILIDSFKNLKAAFIQDNYTAPGSDSVYLRFFNFSPNSQPLSLYDSATATPLYSLRAFNDQAYQPDFANFTKMPAGNYTFQLKQGDSTIASKAYSLGGGHVFTIFAKGFVGGTGGQEVGLGQIQNY